MTSLTYITLFLDKDDLVACRDWYTNNLDLKVVWESEDFLMLQGEKGAQLGLHTGHALDRPDQVQLHFTVENVDRTCSALEKKGVEILGSPRNTPWGYRVAVLQDPAGHTVELYHKL